MVVDRLALAADFSDLRSSECLCFPRTLHFAFNMRLSYCRGTYFSHADKINQFSRKPKVTNPKACAIDICHPTYLVLNKCIRITPYEVRCAMYYSIPYIHVKFHVTVVRINSRDGDSGSRSRQNASIGRGRYKRTKPDRIKCPGLTRITYMPNFAVQRKTSAARMGILRETGRSADPPSPDHPSRTVFPPKTSNTR